MEAVEERWGSTDGHDRSEDHRPGSRFSYLQIYGYLGANPAHSDFVATPAVPRDCKTVGLSPEDCRRLLEAPSVTTPLGIRDRAMLATLA